MRVLSLNVLNGGEDRLGALCGIFSSTRPDVLVLQECVGWDRGEQVRTVQQAIDAPHHVLGVANARPSGTRYHVCIISRFPVVMSTTHTEGFAHCAVEAVIDAGRTRVTVIGTHLVWSDEETRLAEARRLPLRPSSVLAGDLNALARGDPYPADFDRRLQGAEIHKYGHPPRFDVVDHLLARGWIDPLRGAGWTARREKNGFLVETRTDHLLVSPGLPVQRAAIVDVGGASDHHAVLVELDL